MISGSPLTQRRIRLAFALTLSNSKAANTCITKPFFSAAWYVTFHLKDTYLTKYSSGLVQGKKGLMLPTISSYSLGLVLLVSKMQLLQQKLLGLIQLLGGGLWHPDGPALTTIREDIDLHPEHMKGALMDEILRRTFFEKVRKDEKKVVAAFVAENLEGALKTKPKVSCRTTSIYVICIDSTTGF